MGLRLGKVTKDYRKLSIAPPTDLAKPKGVWQGAMLPTLVDTAAGQALRTTLKSDHDSVLVHLDAEYFLLLDAEQVFAEGSVARKAPNLAYIAVAVVKNGGPAVARGWCVLKLMRRAVPALADNLLLRPTCSALRPQPPSDCEASQEHLTPLFPPPVRRKHLIRRSSKCTIPSSRHLPQ
jgi:acyl-coenzyme A thioesterase PaaI-like protein